MIQLLLDEPSLRFAGTPFGPLRLDSESLVYYDGPQLYLGQDADGNVWLCEALNATQPRQYETIAVALSAEEAAFWRAQNSGTDFLEPLRRLFDGERRRWVVVESWGEGDTLELRECRHATHADLAAARPAD